MLILVCACFVYLAAVGFFFYEFKINGPDVRAQFETDHEMNMYLFFNAVVWPMVVYLTVKHHLGRWWRGED